MAIVNGWLMYRKDCEYQGLRKQWQQDLLGFRTGIAESLCKRGKSLEKKGGGHLLQTLLTKHTKNWRKGQLNQSQSIPQEKTRWATLDTGQKIGKDAGIQVARNWPLWSAISAMYTYVSVNKVTVLQIFIAEKLQWLLWDTWNFYFVILRIINFSFFNYYFVLY